MATFKSYFPGGVYPDHYNPPLPGYDYMPFFDEVVNLDTATQIGTATTTSIKFSLSNGLKLKIIGTGFAIDDDGNAVKGTVTGIVLYLNNGTTKMQQLTGLNISLESFIDAAEAFDQFGMAAFLMRGNDTITGNSGEQDLRGYGGNDKFIGGTGDDYMQGGEGDDTYDGNAGFDTLDFSDAYYTSSAYRGISVDVAAGKVTDPYGNSETFTEIESFRGTQFRDVFKGSSADETFMGWGGNDTINGGGGIDGVLYHRDDRRGGTGGVTVNLETGKAKDGFGRTDTLISIENARTGNAADKLYGSSGDNRLHAGGGNDTLAGGLGNDILRGEGGKDIFLFNTKLSASTNVDVIEDFVVADDTIRLDNAIFTKIIGTGTMTSAQFAKNTTGKAADASDRIIYETDTGKLFYDSNGNASGGSVHFATIHSGLSLTASDFYIV
ncbi:calcium-binding protein [Rhizobium sp. Root482]|uniref:calcium-binding protein n=1 Tax=Rhizobium sp. Root482 TaxID=1736543 RepID=UPI0006F68E1E|nr:calcium-binding protein [Rhizobium sp. Root482]KQY12219.1 calcium-binding protein [Rhizobium sp. Root482]